MQPNFNEALDVQVSGTVGDLIAPLPLRLSVPFNVGVVDSPAQIALMGSTDLPITVQRKPLAWWPDGSVKWCLLDWIHQPAWTDLQVRVEHGSSPAAASTAAASTTAAGAEFALYVSASGQLSIQSANGAMAVLNMVAIDGDGQRHQARWSQPRQLERGPVRHQDRLEFRFSDSPTLQALQGVAYVELVPDLSSLIFRVRLRNPQAASHPNGNWDLGNAGSIYFRDVSIEVVSPPLKGGWIHAEHQSAVQEFKQHLSLFQASSGGANWRSTNHLDRHRQVPLAFCGYRSELDGLVIEGKRATPEVYVANEQGMLGVAVERFWENFPKALTADSHTLRLALWPRESETLHELQGGEQKTHEFAVYVGPSADRPLQWFAQGLTAHLTPAGYAHSSVVPYLTPASQDPNEAYLELVNLALEGSDTFEHKREKIDEYGWRNFGDLYGDHEAVHHTAEQPLVSHYNNQYDCTQAFAIHFLRTADLRWWRYMVQMADHAWDIDTYHTQDDKSLYNGGLFWHTYHYADADTGNHRSYPRSLNNAHIMPGGKDLSQLGGTGKKLAANYAVGGGPSASQNYSTGWMWAYYLTGNAEYKAAAVSAADYVINIEDGRKTIFRWLSRQDTGLSMESSIGYYGPGRASGNSLHALLTGYELTGQASYLQAADKLISRVAHPEEDLARLDLLNVELRWFYTMFLQALARYVDLKVLLGQNDYGYSYAVATLAHYAKWMLEHERPNLSEPDKLQYPNETWAAQDLRKWHVLQWAACRMEHSLPLAELQAKADFFFHYAVRTLRDSPTRALCRPVILVLQFGWQRAWIGLSGDQRLPSPSLHTFRARPLFVPQRQIAIRRAKRLLAGGVLAVLTIGLVGLFFVWWSWKDLR